MWVICVSSDRLTDSPFSFVLDESDLVWKAQAATILQEAGLTPEEILRTATARTGKDVLGTGPSATAI